MVFLLKVEISPVDCRLLEKNHLWQLCKDIGLYSMLFMDSDFYFIFPNYRKLLKFLFSALRNLKSWFINPSTFQFWLTKGKN